MCGRITQRSGELPGLVTVEGYGDSRVKDPRDSVRFNGAPSQDFWIVRKHPRTSENQRDRMTWGLIPYWSKDGTGGRKPINVKAETVASLPSFRDAYQHRRCIVPVDNFFEWKAIKGAKTKQPYAIAMKSGEPFALAAIWENWKIPLTEEWMRTFCIITTTANELVGQIHDRMPVILPPDAYDRWLANMEPDPRDLLVPFPSELMKIWPISARVNKPANDDPAILAPIEIEPDETLL